jgi:hypothetical protein
VLCCSPIKKSGNPGYLHGRPVLAGSELVRDSADPSKQVVAQLYDGLTVLNPDQYGSCKDMKFGQGQGIGFGEDQLVTCRMQLTLEELEQVCNQGVMNKLNVTAPWIGSWGNSEYSNIRDWEPMQYEARSGGGRGLWIPNTLKCEQLITTVNVEFLVYSRGSIENSQKSIVGARTFYNTENWHWRGYNTSATGETASNSFYLKATVTFVDAQEEEQVNIRSLTHPQRHAQTPFTPSSSRCMCIICFVLLV